MSKIIQIALLAFIATSVVSAAPLEKRQSCASVWGQCGGQGWTGPTTCCSGSVCTVGNPYYSQCIPGSSNPTTTTNPPPATTTTTKVATQTSPVSSPSPNPGTGSGSVTLGTNWKWSSSNALVGPKLAPGRNTVPYAIKDPSVVFYNGVYHVYASTVNSGGYNLVYLNFTSFENSGNSPHFYMDQLPGWSGYKAAPQLFYFSPQKLWYLIWQSPNPTYSTNSNPGPTGWSSPRQMISSQPSNVPASWIDFFNICDDSRCYLFFSNDNGQWFQTSTAKSSFPNGWGGVTKILDSGVNRIYFEASMIYKVKNGGGNAKYFAAIESGNPSWTRYFHSFTAPSLAGPWTPLTASGEGGFNQPFAGQNNVVWPSAWTRDVSHGELIRTGYDEYIEADFCNLKFLYQGMAPGSSGDYNALPWKLGLLTATSKPSGC